MAPLFKLSGILRRHGRLAAGILAVAALIAVALHQTYGLAYRAALSGVREDTQSAARLKLAVLQSELDKQRAVPVILADDAEVTDALLTPSPARHAAVSRKLERLRHETRSAVIYLINAEGRAVSASNWNQPDSFAGSDYSFRAYFRDALREGTATEFALGRSSGKPGLYLAHRINAASVSGVLVVKTEFDAIEAEWDANAEHTYVTGPQGDVYLTNRPPERFAKASPLPPEQLEVTLAAPLEGWTLHVRRSNAPALAAARNATLITALSLGILAMLGLWRWRRRRSEAAYRQRLEQDVTLRTEALSEANERLSAEIAERGRAERRLSNLQADLVQANKLASLGQITAGVAHEINQPVATIRVLGETCLRLFKGHADPKPIAGTVTENIERIVQMCERIGHITGELRTFSRKAGSELEPVPLKDTIESSVLLNASRLRENRVDLTCGPVPPDLRVMASRVRLEQVLVNLLQNAFEALETVTNPSVRLSVREDGDFVKLSLADNGPGLPPQVMAQLFTPFVTTKPKGLGLGLVIAHDILRDFGGALEVENSDTGAVFTLSLRRAA